METTLRAALFAAVCAAAFASPGSAQGVRTDLLPHTGRLVRATVAANGDTVRNVGVLVEGGEQGLVLQRERSRHLYRIPADALIGLEVGLPRNHGRGAMLGMIYGALGTGLFVGAAAALSDGGRGSDCLVCSRGGAFRLGFVLGAGLGGSLGLVLGGIIGTDEWRRVW